MVYKKSNYKSNCRKENASFWPVLFFGFIPQLIKHYMALLVGHFMFQMREIPFSNIFQSLLLKTLLKGHQVIQ